MTSLAPPERMKQGEESAAVKIIKQQVRQYRADYFGHRKRICKARIDKAVQIALQNSRTIPPLLIVLNFALRKRRSARNQIKLQFLRLPLRRRIYRFFRPFPPEDRNRRRYPYNHIPRRLSRAFCLLDSFFLCNIL